MTPDQPGRVWSGQGTRVAIRPDMETALQRIGLADLIVRFRDEDIDDALFWTLEEPDLKELGLTLGQRKKVISIIRGNGTQPDLSETLPEGFEMRRLTVLFVDMIGSTQLAERLSPDEMNDLFQSFYLAAGALARRFGGYVASLQGDGVIMLFGYPRTRLGDAERALGAALAMQHDLSVREYALPSGRQVEVSYRIGVATGPAVVGRPSEAVAGDGLHMVGQVMHRAARLQTVSPPLGIMVDGPTRSEVEGLFEFEDRPDVALKGFDNVDGLGLLVRRARASASPQPKTASPGQSVGRAAERATLMQAWSEVVQGARRTTVLTGGAGLGKSTLLREGLSEIREAGPRVIFLGCRALSQNSALAPVVRMFDQLIGDAEAATPLARMDALRHVMGGLPETALAPLQRLLLLEDASRGQPDRPMPPAAQRGQLIETLVDWMLRSPAGQPVVIVLEDAHWCDATTRDLLETCASRAEGRSVLFVATSRNQDEPLWSDDPARLRLGLRALEPDAAARLLEQQLDGRPVPAAIRKRILQLSEGNPLMLESLARAFSQDRVGTLGRDVSVPQTLYESVSERLDTLGAGRPVASALAVLDAEADRDLLARMLGCPQTEVDLGMDELLEAGIVARTETGAAMRFHHHLYRDVVYERLVGADRRDLHRRAMAALQEMSLDMGTRSPDVLATHAAAAGAPGQAAPLALSAGERFLAASALVEADHYLQMAMSALSALDIRSRTEEHKRLRMRVLTGLAAVKRGRLGIAHDEVRDLAQQTLTLACELGDTRAEFLARAGLYAHALVGADYRRAHSLAEALVTFASRTGERVFTMISRRALGQVALHVGRFEHAETELRAALDAYDEEQDLVLAYTHGYDHAEISAAFLAYALWMRGDLVAAREMSRFSVDHARKIAHAHSLGQAQAFRGMLAGLAVDDGDLVQAADDALDTADRFDIKLARGAGLTFGLVARVLARNEVPDAARLRALEAHMAELRRHNPYNYWPTVYGLAARVYLQAGEVDRAESCVAAALEDQERTGEVWTAPELDRLCAAIQRARGEVDAANRAAELAFDRAASIGSVTLALRIACDLVEFRGMDRDFAALRQVAARIVSDDDGWDMRRYRRLMSSGSAIGARTLSANR